MTERSYLSVKCDNITEIFDLSLFVCHVGGDVLAVGNGAAADNSNFHREFLLCCLLEALSALQSL